MKRSLVMSAAACLLLAACNAGTNSPSIPASSSASSSSSSALAPGKSLIISSPDVGARVQSPLLVKGKARGGWFFEASFPVQVQDMSGSVLVTAPAQAQGEWMTSDYVDFSVTLTFTTSQKSGFLVFKKDNPSGLPENDEQVKIPVNF